MAEIDDVLEGLLGSTGASRVTLRETRRGLCVPVTHEALSPGVGSLREERTVDLRTQPVALEVAAGRQVVRTTARRRTTTRPSTGCARRTAASPRRSSPRCFRGDSVVGIVSLHQLGEPRHWTDEEIDWCCRGGGPVWENSSDAQPLAPRHPAARGGRAGRGAPARDRGGPRRAVDAREHARRRGRDETSASATPSTGPVYVTGAEAGRRARGRAARLRVGRLRGRRR